MFIEKYFKNLLNRILCRLDAGEDKKVSREEFTSETVRNKLETVIL